MELSAISEAMNQMMGSAATAMSDFFERSIDISPPNVSHQHLDTGALEIDSIRDDTGLVQIAFRIEVEDLVDSEILQLIPLDFAVQVSSELLSSLNGEESPGAAKTAAEPPPIEEPPGIEEAGEPAEEEPFTATGAEGPREEKAPAAEMKKAPDFLPDDLGRLNLIKDIPVELYVVLGRAKYPLKRLFSLHPGDVVSLDHYIGEPVELLANNRLVARGEIVMVNGQFGVKITALLR